MWSAASNNPRLCVLLTIFVVAPLTLAAPECRCPGKPNGPGGGVKCTEDQIAICDSSKGECNCECQSIKRGRTKEEYISSIFSNAAHEYISTDDLSQPWYRTATTDFLKTEKSGSFVLNFKTKEGNNVHATIGVPDWLVTNLKTGKGSGTFVFPEKQ